MLMMILLDVVVLVRVVVVVRRRQKQRHGTVRRRSRSEELDARIAAVSTGRSAVTIGVLRHRDAPAGPGVPALLGPRASVRRVPGGPRREHGRVAGGAGVETRPDAVRAGERVGGRAEKRGGRHPAAGRSRHGGGRRHEEAAAAAVMAVDQPIVVVVAARQRSGRLGGPAVAVHCREAADRGDRGTGITQRAGGTRTHLLMVVMMMRM